jgi:hypothetical protein
VGQLFEECAQSGEAAYNNDFDLLATVVVLLQIFLGVETSEHEAVAFCTVLNSL